MKQILFVLVLAACVIGCRSRSGGSDVAASALSPDGKNEIRLFVSPLSYEVVRDGTVVVARTPIGLTVDGRRLEDGVAACAVSETRTEGAVATPVYKKARVDLTGRETYADFGSWGIRLAARDDGVAYRFETRLPGTVTVNGENASLTIPSADAKALVYRTERLGWEEAVPTNMTAGAITTEGKKAVYLPFVYQVGGKTVAVTESDVRDYPWWYLKRTDSADGVAFGPLFSTWALETKNNDHHTKATNVGGPRLRKMIVTKSADYLLKTAGTRTFPWRAFVLADAPSGLCESDLVYALAAPASPDEDFSWVRPGKVAWDWWNAFDNQGKAGCNTKTYERFIDFAAATGVEYVIMDEGWSERLNIWKFHPEVDVPHLIRYAEKKGVGIILWMAWAQVYGEEDRVAAHFAQLGAKGFKVDFMDRSDAEIATFVERFAAACARQKMLVDYHGMVRPTGLSRRYPNIVNYEAVHGLEQMKFYHGADMGLNDVAAFFARLTAGPMDYTPGAMVNLPVGTYPTREQDPSRYVNPGSEGTRCRQMAMIPMYEAPLQMLSDSPTHYEKNMECFRFMADTPVVWDETLGLGGDPESFSAVARRKGGVWYAAALTNRQARDYALDTAFLGSGEWTVELFRDGPDAARAPESYVREVRRVRAGEKMLFHMAPGGGFVARFSK